MRGKATLILIIILTLSLIITGCQNNAAKKPARPDKAKKETPAAITLTDSEQRILASKVSNMAKLVEGVERASVVVVNPGTLPKGAIKKTTTTKVESSTKKTAEKKAKDATNPDKNIKALTQDQDSTRVVSRQGVIVIIGTSVTEGVRADEDKWKKAKNTIQEKVMASDDRISEVFITNDPDIVSQIDELAAAILQGKGSENYKDEIKDILNKINSP